MKISHLAALVFAYTLASASAQSAFEVASVKPVDPKTQHPSDLKVYPGGRVVLRGFPLKTLICTAFELANWQLSGGEPWVENDKYDIEAKPPESVQPTIQNLRYTWWEIDDPRLREMLKALLIDRFQLKVHRETKTGEVYVLEKSGKPLKLRPVEARPKPPADGFSGEVEFTGGQWFLFNTSMPQLARFAGTTVLHAPVLDRTGLTGAFDYKEPSADEDLHNSPFADNFKRLIPLLGLKLERTTGPVETFIIDHAEKPSAN